MRRQADDALNRRQLLKIGAAAVAAGAASAPEALREQTPAAAGPFAAPLVALVRIGFVGVGLHDSGPVRAGTMAFNLVGHGAPGVVRHT